MSIIGTIRNKFTWVLLILIALAILAFLLMDSTNGRGSALSGQDFAVGSIDGKKIKYSDLQTEMRKLKEIYPQANEEQLNNTAWNNLVDQKFFDAKYEQAGIYATNEEIANAIFSEEPHPIAKQYFGSLFPDGKYDPATVKSFIEESENKDLMMQQLTTALSKSIKESKYSALLKNGINAPTWLAEDTFLKEEKTANLEYLLLPYTLVSDEEVSYTDNDLLAYAKSNPERFSSNGGTIVEYVRFPKKASKVDTTNVINDLQNLKTQFQSASNAQTFAQNNTAVNGANSVFNTAIKYQTASTLNLPEDQKSRILNANENEVVGPFVAGGIVHMVKVLDKKNVADSAKVRHILVKDEQLADSLVTVLKADKSKFNSFVKEYSTDTPSVEKDGVYDFFPQGRMVPEFNAAAFNNEIGSIEVVPTQFGFHIVEPLARKGSNKGVELAIVSKSVSASDATYDKIYNDAKTFAEQNKTKEKFEAEAKKIGGMQTTPEIAPNAKQIPGIGENYEMIKWVNKAPINSVKNFDSTNAFIVARIVSRFDEGEIDLEKNRVLLEAEVKKEKKAAILKDQIKEKGGVEQGVSALASQFGRKTENATEAKFSGSGTGIGFEPNVMANVFLSGADGLVKKPIEGNRGVYVVDVKGTNKVQSTQSIDDIKLKEMNNLLPASSVGGLRTKYKEKGIIKDERYKARR